jgi:hypothetical protein
MTAPETTGHSEDWVIAFYLKQRCQALAARGNRMQLFLTVKGVECASACLA